MGSGVHIKASEQYFDYNTSDNITLSLTVSEIHQKWTYCSFRVQVEGEGVWSSRITNIMRRQFRLHILRQEEFCRECCLSPREFGVIGRSCAIRTIIQTYCTATLR